MADLPPRTAWRVRKETPEPGRPDFEGLIDLDVDAIPARIAIVQNDYVTGWDDGALGFDEDAIWFSGEATSFRIVAPDVRSRRFDRQEASRMSVSRLLAHGLPLAHPTRDVRVRFSLLPDPERQDWKDEERLAKDIRRLWLLGVARGESQYPPLLPRPGAQILSWAEWAARRSFEGPCVPDLLSEVGKAVLLGRTQWRYLDHAVDLLVESIREEEEGLTTVSATLLRPLPEPTVANRAPHPDLPPCATWHVKKPLPAPEPPDLGGLVEEGTDALAVRMTIVQDDIVTGWDDGALGFEEDATWFSGRATSFRIAASDILPGTHLLSRLEPVTDGEALRQGLPLRHPERKVWVRFELLTKDEELKALNQAIQIAGVKRARAATGGGESQYPPLIVHPGMQGTNRIPPIVYLLLGISVVSLVVTSFVQIVVLHRNIGGLITLLLLTVLAIALALFSPNPDHLKPFREDETGQREQKKEGAPDAGR